MTLKVTALLGFQTKSTAFLKDRRRHSIINVTITIIRKSTGRVTISRKLQNLLNETKKEKKKKDTREIFRILEENCNKIDHQN